MVAYIKEVNGRHIGDGVFYDEVEAARLIERGVAMDAREYRKMLEDKKEHAKEMRADRKEAADKKAPEAPKKDKMIRAPMRKK
jgi:hypothetical protein